MSIPVLGSQLLGTPPPLESGWFRWPSASLLSRTRPSLGWFLPRRAWWTTCRRVFSTLQQRWQPRSVYRGARGQDSGCAFARPWRPRLLGSCVCGLQTRLRHHISSGAGSPLVGGSGHKSAETPTPPPAVWGWSKWRTKNWLLPRISLCGRPRTPQRGILSPRSPESTGSGPGRISGTLGYQAQRPVTWNQLRPVGVERKSSRRLCSCPAHGSNTGAAKLPACGKTGAQSANSWRGGLGGRPGDCFGKFHHSVRTASHSQPRRPSHWTLAVPSSVWVVGDKCGTTSGRSRLGGLGEMDRSVGVSRVSRGHASSRDLGAETHQRRLERLATNPLATVGGER